MNLALISINLPDPRFNNCCPIDNHYQFGVHQATFIDEHFSSYCGGILEVRAINSDGIHGGSENEPIEVRCNECDFNFRIGGTWIEASWEWVRIVFSCGLAFHRFDKSFEGLFTANNYLSSFLPYMDSLKGGKYPVLPKYASEASMFSDLLPIFGRYGIAISMVNELDTLKGMTHWAILSALLLRNFEVSYEKRVKDLIADPIGLYFRK